MNAKLKERIEQALRAACVPDAHPRIALEDVPPDRVAGEVVSTTFADLSPTERQDRIWAELDKSLAVRERTRISFIVTVTPKEHRALGGRTSRGGATRAR